MPANTQKQAPRWDMGDANIRVTFHKIAEYKFMIEEIVEQIAALPHLAQGTTHSKMLLAIYLRSESLKASQMKQPVRLSDVSELAIKQVTESNMRALEVERERLDNFALLNILTYGSEAPKFNMAGHGIMIKLTEIGEKVGFRLSEREKVRKGDVESTLRE